MPTAYASARRPSSAGILIFHFGQRSCFDFHQATIHQEGNGLEGEYNMLVNGFVRFKRSNQLSTD
jgi:hypothetical protein